MNPFLLVLIILAAAAGGLAIWTGVVALVGMMGWRTIADRYPAGRWPAPGEGVALSWQSAAVGLSSYGSALHAVLTEDGLYLRPARIFAINHPPMLIPWAEMGEGERAIFGGVRLRLAAGGTLTLSGRLGRLVGEALAAAHAGAEEGASEGVSDERTERRAGLRVG